MNTTNLFVELIVIGVGGACWLGLLLVTFFGYEWIPVDKLFSLPAAVPALSFIYLSGIIADRIADKVFESLDKRNCKSFEHYCDNRQQFYDDINLILNSSERFAALYEYGRSRQRITRGWTVNAVLIAAALDLFIFTHFRDNPDALKVAGWGTLFLSLLAVSSYYSWVMRNKQQYRKLHPQAQFLREIEGKRLTTASTRPPDSSHHPRAAYTSVPQSDPRVSLSVEHSK